MKGALGPLLLSLLLLLQAGGCQEVKVVAAVGDTVQLQPNTWLLSWVTVNWILKRSSQTYWILKYEQNRTSASPFLPFADRVSFHPGNLSLQINSVTEKESGLYIMDLKLTNGSKVTSNFRLFVLDRVQQPKIKASTSQERGWCYVTLSCLVPKADWVTYSWSRGVSSSPAPEDHWLQEHQADLQLEITKSGNNTFYHCNVSNAISWGMATIDVKPLCNYTEIPFHCQSDLAKDDEYVQTCLNGLYQILPGSREAMFCSLFNTTLKIFKASCGNTSSTPTLKNTVASFDKVLDDISVKSLDKKEVASAATLILQGLSSAALAAALASPENRTQTVTTDQMVVQTKLVDGYCDLQTNSLRLDAQKDTIDIHCTDITEDGKGSAAVAFISYTDLASVLGIQFFQEKALQREEYAHINSRVVSATSSTQRRNVTNPVNLTFRHNTDMFPQDEVICVHWNSEGSNGTWSSQGCQRLQSNITHSQCSCYYLASFAILMSPSPIKASVALSIISYAGLMISLICLILAIVTFLFSHTVKNTSSNFIHLQLSIFLFLADIIFLAGVNQTYIKLLCSIIAGVLHYLFLACFAWMFMEGVNLCLIVRNLKVANYAGAGRHMKICMYAFGYGFPAVIVMISAISFPSGYGTPYQ